MPNHYSSSELLQSARSFTIRQAPFVKVNLETHFRGTSHFTNKLLKTFTRRCLKVSASILQILSRTRSQSPFASLQLLRNLFEMASTMFATLWMVVFPTLLLAFLLTCEVRLICFFVFESKFVALLLTHVFEAVWILLAWKLILMALHDRKTSLPHGFIDTSLLHTAAPTSVNSKRLSSTPTSEGDALPEVKNMSGTKSEETAAGVSEPISNLVTMDEPSSDRNWPRAPQPKRLVERQKGLLSLIPAATVTKRKHKSVLMSKLQVEQRARDRKKTSTEVGRVHSLTAGSDSYKSASLARPPKRCQPNSQCTRPIRLTDLPAEIRNSK